MTDRFQSLFVAIVRDDRARVKGMLDRDASLAAATARAGQFESRIAHWIYAGDTPLHVAAAGHRAEISGMLLAAGADVGAAGNHRRSQPLHYASDGHWENPAWDPSRQVATIRLLIDSGADVGATDKNGATPLHRAVRTRCAAAVTCLLEAGSDASVKNRPGSTPFHLAVQNTGRGGSGSEKAKLAQAEIIRAFLDRGITPVIKDARNRSVLDWARSDSIRRMLKGGVESRAKHPRRGT